MNNWAKLWLCRITYKPAKENCVSIKFKIYNRTFDDNLKKLCC